MILGDRTGRFGRLLSEDGHRIERVGRPMTEKIGSYRIDRPELPTSTFISSTMFTNIKQPVQQFPSSPIVDGYV
jgi:hypothetical protein